jgi:hypothetical protein
MRYKELTVVVAAVAISALIPAVASAIDVVSERGNKATAQQAQSQPAERQEERSAVEVEREQLMMKLLKQPPVPLKTQDKVVRILFLPYVDTNGVLHNHKYSFLSVEEGKWVLGDYLMKPTVLDRRVLKPLANPASAPPAPQKPDRRQREDADTPRQPAPPQQPMERDRHDEDSQWQ